MMSDDSDDDFNPGFASPPEWAALYRRAGLQVVPAKTHREDPVQWKRPCLPEWRPLSLELAPDLTFARWYGATGEYVNRTNMGLLTGSCSGGVFVLDLDTYKPGSKGAAWWAGLMAVHNNNESLRTPTHTTGGGGKQMLFRAPAGWISPTNRFSIGVDVRGQGGFAMLPPSNHDSGKSYRWDDGFELWNPDTPILEAPAWLCEAIDQLVADHGGGHASAPRERVAAPGDVNAWGKLVDGREDYMTRVVWAAVLDLYRDSPIKPAGPISLAAMVTTYDTYLANVATRLPDTTENGLEREGRGLSMFQEKWEAAMRQWDGKVREEANKPNPKKGAETLEIKPEEHAAAVEATKARIELIAWDDLPDVRVNWLIKDFLPAGGFAALYGKPGAYKSFIALYLAASIATGAAAFGRDTTQGDVIYIAGEGGAGLKKRRDAFMKKYGLGPGTRVHFIRAQLNLRSTEADVDAVVEVLRARGLNPVLIIVDTLARAFAGGNENASEDMGAFIRQIGRLQEGLGHPAVLIVHHCGKDEARGMRGHSSLFAAVDTELEVVKLSADGAIERTGQLTVTKQKDGEDDFKLTYRLELIPLSPLTGEGSLVVVPDDTLTAAKGLSKPLTRNQKAVLDALKMTIGDTGKRVANDHIPRDVLCASIKLWRLNYYAMGGLEGQTAKKAFDRGRDDLRDRGTVGVWADHAWIVNDL